MAEKVVGTREALRAIQNMKRIINGPLMEQVDALNREAQTLSDPNFWEGRLARQFRSEWPQTHNALLRAKEGLEELRTSSQGIINDIMRAGGF